MSSLIQKVVHCARETFKRTTTKPYKMVKAKEEFLEAITELQRLVNLLTAADLGLQYSHVLNSVTEQGDRRSSLTNSNITYIDVFENRDVTIGIFILHPNGKIPLHNHPDMYGVVKCLEGDIELTSYSQLNPIEGAKVKIPGAINRSHDLEDLDQGLLFPVRRSDGTILNPNSKCSCLTPEVRNYHELNTVPGSGPAAFIDILAPPYTTEDSVDESDDHRDCDFFQVDDTLAVCDPDIAWLRWIQPPQDYSCSYEQYRGPIIE